MTTTKATDTLTELIHRMGGLRAVTLAARDGDPEARAAFAATTAEAKQQVRDAYAKANGR